MKAFFKIYGVTVVIALIYFEIFSRHSHDGFFANLGSAVVWPAVMFPALGRLIGGVLMLVVVTAILLHGRRR
ncbi:hypothetical protein B1992_00590 [Pseudoxanthomonas broegbernensis]|uniref:Uncharacterized protein n=1 Tax=Pseudoxanthomonas broegbernensis TaxID=83619 RepID=A0A7V8GPT9_9GAMM|nr:hypothetical protein [Pseudoxanthomonas broegbernensis]KAF1687970.1 hypothetical protein B1992_00590 [Pseudoxanthomonas broegbernensis]MBB6064983.1 hypothetical protein [Pseudoxanthomonas broegbernensis]